MKANRNCLKICTINQDSVSIYFTLKTFCDSLISKLFLIGPSSPGGVAYGREVEPPDWVLDYWHPLEKARYPEYFARREQRKKEWVEMWEKQYGKPKPGEYDHH